MVKFHWSTQHVVLSRQMDERVKGWIKNKLESLGLNLNEDMKKVVNLRTGSFDFLGFSFPLYRKEG